MATACGSLGICAEMFWGKYFIIDDFDDLALQAARSSAVMVIA